MFGLNGGDFRRILDFATPSFFEVVPAGVLWRQARALMASRRDRAGFDAVLGHLGPLLREHEVGVELCDVGALNRSEGWTKQSSVAQGEAVLRLYFAQLAHCDAAALDLRPQRFISRDGAVLWSPTPLVARWSPDFLQGIRDLYSGFYGDNHALFEDAGHRLGLTPALDLFIQNFGPGDQRAVVFDREAFKDTFHSIFLRCKQEKITLNEGFIALGAYLGALYENLSTCDEPLDVRSAFEAVWTR